MQVRRAAIEAQRVLLPFSHGTGQKTANNERRTLMSDKVNIARQFMEAIPHSRDLGMVLTEIENGVATIMMPYDERLIGDPETGVVHGARYLR
jgi:hypothetical protein